VTALPEQVRSRLVALAADLLGTMRADEVPASLRPVARFTSTKRARLGATAIAATLEADSAFRARVLDAAAAAHPGLVDAVREQSPPAAADPVDVAVLAYLLRPPGWEDLVAAGQTTSLAESEARATRESAAAERLREQLSAARAAARESRDRYRREIERLKADNAGLRRRLNEARERAAAAREAENLAETELTAVVERAEAGRAAAEAEARRLRARLAAAEEALEAARRASREGRGLETARLGLLLDTLAEAAAGLRRELALPATSLRPADSVPAREPAAEDLARGRAADDPAQLAELLSLPKVHLIVDGYNVTKTAWAELALEAQRTRLVQRLGALASRTGVEVTCVFDGADVTVPPTPAATGVRVRFSPPGETADDLIHRLVRAEPPGRPVMVASSDREVANAVRRSRASSVDAVALLGLLGG
jgi:hypothetical protein